MRRALTWSLLLNVLLLAAVFFVHASKARKGEPAAFLPDMTNRQVRVERSAPRPVPEPQIVETNEPFHWSRLESEDYRVYVANLKAIGCPSDTIEDIIRADVQELFERKVADLVAVEAANFWTLICDQEAFDEKVSEKADVLEKLEDEREEMLEALIGPEESRRDVDTEAYEISHANEVAHLLGFLSPGKRTEVLGIQQRFLGLQLQLSSEQNAAMARAREHGSALAMEAARAWQAKADELHRQEQEALQAALSPAEYQEYQLRTAYSTGSLRRLVGFSASEAELKRLTELETSFGGPAGQGRAAALRAGHDANAERSAALEQYLGPDRFAAYERAHDPRFSNAHEFVRRAGLDADAACRIYQLQCDAEARFQQLERDKGLESEERQEKLSELGVHYRAIMTNMLGASYPQYVRVAGGWVKQF